MDLLQVESLKIEARYDVQPALVVWSGSIDVRDPAQLINPFVDKMVSRLAGHSCTVDFRKLEYMNSSSVTPILRMVKAFAENHITAEVQYSVNVEWQRASFRALNAIAMRLTGIKVTGLP